MRAFRVAGFLAGFLAIATLIILISRPDYHTRPTAGSFEPSGGRALRELLQRQGYQVRVTQDLKPRLEPDETAIALCVENTSWFTAGLLDAALEAVDAHIKEGGRAIVTYLPGNFEEATKEGGNTLAHLQNEFNDDVLRVNTSGMYMGNDPPKWLPEDTEDWSAIWFSQDEHFAVVAHTGNGKGVYVLDGLSASNRFLSESDNAAFWTQLVAAVTPKGGRVVFVDAAAGEAFTPGLLDVMGGWARPVLMQIYVLLGFLIYAKGKRLGVLDQSRRKQMGQRELVDALASTYQRSQATGVALRAILKAADRKLRTAFKLSLDSPVEKLKERLPEATASQMERLESMAAFSGPAEYVMGTVRAFEESVNECTGKSRSNKPKRR